VSRTSIRYPHGLRVLKVSPDIWRYPWGDCIPPSSQSTTHLHSRRDKMGFYFTLRSKHNQDLPPLQYINHPLPVGFASGKLPRSIPYMKIPLLPNFYVKRPIIGCPANYSLTALETHAFMRPCIPRHRSLVASLIPYLPLVFPTNYLHFERPHIILAPVLREIQTQMSATYLGRVTRPT
jgi:hypothetical protein